MSEKPPLFWLKQVSSVLEDLKQIPLWGFPPTFPLDACADKIAALLHVSDVKIALEKSYLGAKEELAAGLGAHPIQTTLELTPLAEPFYLLMGQEDVRKLSTIALSSHSDGKGFTSPALQEGFYHFLGLQIAESIDQLAALADLSLKIGASRPLCKEEAFCFDISLKIAKHSPLWARLLCPHPFRSAFKTHFSRAPSGLLGPLSSHVELSLSAQVGKTGISLSQWNKVKEGDALLLDTCSFDPQTKKGIVTLMLHNTPLLLARPKAEELKIVDYAVYNEELMSKEELFPGEAPQEQNDEEGEKENHLWSSKMNKEEIISSQEIPLQLVIEVGRINISLEKLLQLSPGNVLELPVRPEQGVDLCIGGKKVAKGELIKLGDALAVKITYLRE